MDQKFRDLEEQNELFGNALLLKWLDKDFLYPPIDEICDAAIELEIKE
tara:strand:+ start:558 stop:701 length:144 start_codon:yes stop_codon:yes gene_type:complete